MEKDKIKIDKQFQMGSSERERLVKMFSEKWNEIGGTLVEKKEAMPKMFFFQGFADVLKKSIDDLDAFAFVRFKLMDSPDNGLLFQKVENSDELLQLSLMVRLEIDFAKSCGLLLPKVESNNQALEVLGYVQEYYNGAVTGFTFVKGCIDELIIARKNHKGYG
jgi:hypothetical protein